MKTKLKYKKVVKWNNKLKEEADTILMIFLPMSGLVVFIDVGIAKLLSSFGIIAYAVLIIASRLSANVYYEELK